MPSGFTKPMIQSMKKIDCAIFSAMPEELEFFQNIFSACKAEAVTIKEFHFKIYEYQNKKILLAQTGLGTIFAASVLTLVHHHFHPDYVFLTGTAGGIKTGLNIRDVIIVEQAFEAEIQGAFKLLKGTPFESCLKHPLKDKHFPPIYSADEELLEIAKSLEISDGQYVGKVVSSNSFPAPPELFERIKDEDPYSIDMETSAFYQVGWLLDIHVLAVRGISNRLNYDGSDDKVHESDVKGSAEAAAKTLLKILDILLQKLNKPKIQDAEIKTHCAEAEELIERLHLQPHPEGGYYAQTFKSTIEVKSLDKNTHQNENRSAGTSIYYLLKEYDFSAWHSLKSDEIWHFYKGSPVKVYVIHHDGHLIEHLLGDPLKVEGAVLQVMITANQWFAAEVVDKASYCLVGCTVSPGFEFKDFKLANRESLNKEHPHLHTVIEKFTRDN